MKNPWLCINRMALLALACGGAAAADKVVNIGYQAPLTGQYAQYGVIGRAPRLMKKTRFQHADLTP